jgi:hypothetical protein
MLGIRSVAVAFLLVTVSPSVFAYTQADTPKPASPDVRFRIGRLLYSDDFQHGLGNWAAEQEMRGKVEASDGALDIDVPAGLTLWFRPRLQGPVMITYKATVVAAGGRNDNVTDLNCFWMATDPAHPDDILAGRRSGKFSDYNDLLTYYVGVGGNGNKTTRFRRYIGSKTVRPLRPQDDLSAPDDMIVPNRTATIQLVADGPLIQYYLDGRKLFEMLDPHPYTSGWFAIRTVHNHMHIQDLRIFRLLPAAAH